jgi:putative ATP-dependent endonuclease of OLD family
MLIQCMTICGFRSFGLEPHQIDLAGKLTAIVGPNASGKTALLQALTKMFGISRAQRTILRSDFHLPPGVAPDDQTTRTLFVDVVIAFPELAEGAGTAHTVAPAFKHMLIVAPQATPVCRIRLEARWEDDGTADGEVIQELFWVTKLADKIEDTDKVTVTAADRRYIQVYYTPAARDAAAQIRATTGALAARLLRSIEWSKDTRKAVDDAAQKLTVAFDAEAAITAISEALSDCWSDLEDGTSDTEPSLSLISPRFEDVVAKIQVLFAQGPIEIPRGLDALSDGQQSLFYFALAAAVFDLERKAAADKITGFRAEELHIPSLTIFAIEEPENHLSPYFLSRIIGQVRSMTQTAAAQALVTSHSPAVLSRVQPEEVRYCRCDPNGGSSTVKSVKLPENNEEAVKFVRGAMLAFPELYFARFVVLVEGDSERIVLPRLAEAEGLQLDPSFVAVVPLGGRHVHHFWRLLSGLGIPYVTLLDLDIGRSDGAYGRIKNALAQLIAIGLPRDDLLTLDDGKVMTEGSFARMHEWAVDDTIIKTWIAFLEGKAVFFSQPLDLDMAMLAAYPDAYAKVITEGSGPKMETETAAKVVLGEGGPGLAVYTNSYARFAEHFPAYRYHFLTRSKPATHLQAFAHLDDAALKKGLPEPYRVLLNHVSTNVKRD